MTSRNRNSVSATELANLGKCKALIEPRPGVVRRNTSFKSYWGDRHHASFEVDVNKFMKDRDD